MGSFKEMVQQKRVKVLILVVFLCLAFCYIKGDIPDIKYFGSRNFSICVIDGDARNSGIGWIYPDYYDVETETFFYPNINNSFSTNFVKSLPSEWAIDGWFLTDGTPLDVILDTRWENVETLKSNQEFKHSNDASIHFKGFPIAFSILATKNVEILLSEGWNPREFASYFIVIGGEDAKQVLFKRIKSFDENITYEDLIKVNKGDLNILSNEAWKTFKLDFDAKTGVLELSHVIDNRFVTLFKTEDEKPLKPLFLLTRNLEGTARWKILNRKYLYTNQSGEFKFGPELETPSVEICISIYVALCNECKIDFYIYNNSKKEYLSQTVRSTNLHGRKIWKEVKLIKTDNKNDTVQIYISTYTTNNSSNNSAAKFWALDEVRVCTQHEIKISQIKSSKYPLDDPSVTCQSLRYEKWRPKRTKITPRNATTDKLTVKKVTTTTITLKLPGDMLLTNIYTYAYKALGTKMCPLGHPGFPRNKSNGFVTTAENEISLGGLVPYTFYDVRVTDPIHGWSEMTKVLTSQTELPTKEELPQNVSIKPTNVSVVISWDKVNCAGKFGNLVYQINLTRKETKFMKTQIGTINQYTFSGLKSFANYSLDVVTTREEKYLTQNRGLLTTATYNFTTLPGVAPKVNNFEVYSTDLRSIEMRYQLPKETNGIPVEVSILNCLYEYVCQTNKTLIERCSLWKDYYCIRLPNLMEFKLYFISIRLRNNGTTYFGDFVKTKTITEFKAPGKPTELSYKMLNCTLEEDYCNLEVKWKHPFDQKSTIEKFELTLNESVPDDQWSILIKEMYKVDGYRPVYTHIVRYIPYSTEFNVSVRSSNLYFSSASASLIAKTDHLGKHIDQLPRLFGKTGTNVTFKVPTKDFRLQSLILIAIVQDNDATKNATVNFYNLTDTLCQNYGDTWIANVTEEPDLMDGKYAREPKIKPETIVLDENT